MTTDRELTLAQIAGRIRRRKLTGGDIELLRAHIAALAQGAPPQHFARLAVRNLQLADTQLRHLSRLRRGSDLDAMAFDRLPPHLRSRIATRLDGLAQRLAAATDAPPAQAGEPVPDDPAFRCVGAYRRCRSRNDAEGAGAAFWCQLALIVCLLRTLLPISRSAGLPGPGAPK